MAVIDNSQIHNYQEGFLIYDETYIFKGKFLSSQPSIISEICFNTTMTGYQETMTDPSYKSQFITFTFPMIGIVGTNKEDYESWKIHASGILDSLPLNQCSSFWSPLKAITKCSSSL